MWYQDPNSGGWVDPQGNFSWEKPADAVTYDQTLHSVIPEDAGFYSYTRDATGAGGFKQGSASGIAPGDFADIGQGTRDEILNRLLGNAGVSREQWNSQLSSRGLNDPYAFLGAGLETDLGTLGRVTEGVGTARNNMSGYLGMLEAAGYDWRSDPALSGAYNQAQQQAVQQARAINEMNTRGTNWGEVLGAALGVWGGGYLAASALGGMGGLGSAAGLGEAGAAGLGEAGWGVTQGAGGAVDWISALEGYGGLESLGGLNAAELAGLGVTPESLGLGSSLGNMTGLEDYFTDFGSNFGPTGEGMFPTGAEDFAGAWGQVGGGSSSLDYLKRAQDLYKMVGGGGGGGGGGAGGGDESWGTNLSRLFGGGGGLGDLLGKGLGLAPVLAALNSGYNQTGFDTGRLEDLYGQYNPQAMAGQYDLNTGLGRNELTSSLGRRGVLGSSFGNMDLANYNTARDIGRSQLISGAVQPAAGIAGQILGANIAEQKLKNDLIGQGARAIGSMFGGGAASSGGGRTGGGGSGGNDWLSAILRTLGGSGTQTASYQNPLDVWNV